MLRSDLIWRLDLSLKNSMWKAETPSHPQQHCLCYLFKGKRPQKYNLSIVMIGGYITCWLRESKLGHLIVSPLFLPSRGIGLRILHLSSGGFLVCFPSPIFTQGKSREEILYASGALWDVNLLHATWKLPWYQHPGCDVLLSHQGQPPFWWLSGLAVCSHPAIAQTYGFSHNFALSLLPAWPTASLYLGLPAGSVLNQHSDLLRCNLRH